MKYLKNIINLKMPFFSLVVLLTACSWSHEVYNRPYSNQVGAEPAHSLCSRSGPIDSLLLEVEGARVWFKLSDKDTTQVLAVKAFSSVAPVNFDDKFIVFQDGIEKTPLKVVNARALKELLNSTYLYESKLHVEVNGNYENSFILKGLSFSVDERNYVVEDIIFKKNEGTFFYGFNC